MAEPRGNDCRCPHVGREDNASDRERRFITTKAMNFTLPTPNEQPEPNALALRVREHLQGIVKQAVPITYQALAKGLRLTPPNTIHQLTEALESLMVDDAAADRPFIAALVISKARSGLPAPGFFDCAERLGRFDGDAAAEGARAFHVMEFNAAVTFWEAAAAREHIKTRGF